MTRLRRLASLAAVVGTLASDGAYAAPHETVLYRFNVVAGSLPVGGLIADSSGALYGTTRSGGVGHAGTVFKLTPPAAGSTTWTENTLLAFNIADGSRPEGTLLADAAGNLYGTTYVGGPAGYGMGGAGYGTVFELTPPAQGGTTWTETVLYGFPRDASHGTNPAAALIADSAGALYGTAQYGGSFVSGYCPTYGCGVVFRLTPPTAGQTQWTETVLHAFVGTDGSGPVSTLLADAAGALYGTTLGGGDQNGGTVFKLTPPAAGGSAWTETVLYAFHGSGGNAPSAGLIADASGALYGTTSLKTGSVFKLRPPPPGGLAWTETVLHVFHGLPHGGYGPLGSLIMDAGGALYGTTSGGDPSYTGIAFKLTPPSGGRTECQEAVLHDFGSRPHDGSYPQAQLLMDGSGALYGTTLQGGRGSGHGTVFKIVP